MDLCVCAELFSDFLRRGMDAKVGGDECSDINYFWSYVVAVYLSFNSICTFIFTIESFFFIVLSVAM